MTDSVTKIGQALLHPEKIKFMMVADRSEKKLLSVGFVVVGLCLLTIALRLDVSPSARVIDAVLGVASVAAGLARLFKNRNRKGRRINF